MKSNSSNVVECAYVSPFTHIITLSTEGMLCASAGVEIEEWVNDDDPLAI